MHQLIFYELLSDVKKNETYDSVDFFEFIIRDKCTKTFRSNALWVSNERLRQPLCIVNLIQFETALTVLSDLTVKITFAHQFFFFFLNMLWRFKSRICCT